MSPLVPVIVSAVINGAKEVLTSKKALKENLSEDSTKGAAALGAIVAGNATVNPPQTAEELIFNALLALYALGMFFYRKHSDK